MFCKKTRARGVGIFLVMVLLVSIMGGCAGTAAPAAGGDAGNTPEKPVETIKLSMSVMWGQSMAVVAEILPAWNEHLKKATGGKVEIVVYPGGTLSSSTEAYEGVVQGISDMAIVAYPLTRGRFPVIEAFLLPGISYNNSVAASYAIDEGIRTLKPKEHDDAQYLWGFATGPGEIQSQKAIRTLEDLSKFEIAVNSGTRVQAMELLGASPNMIPTPDWYEAMQRGVVRGALIAGEVLDGYRQFEVNGNYITVTPYLFCTAFGVVMNQDKWNSLPKDVQDALLERPENITKQWDVLNKKAYDINKTNKEVEVIYLSDEEHARWKKKIEPLIDTHVELLNGMGIDGQEVMKQVRALSDKYNALYPDVAPYLN